MARGWRLVMSSWALVWETPVLLVLPAASLLLITAAVASIFAFAGGPAAIAGGHLGRGVFLWGLIIDYPWTLVSVFCGVAFASQVSARLDGGRGSLGGGLQVAWSRRRAIAWWALLSAGIGALLRGVSEVPGLGRFADPIAMALGGAWGLVTVFVVPVMALETGGAREAIAASARTFRARWAEELTGGLVTDIVGTLATAPGFLVLVGGAALYTAGAAAALPVIGVGLLLLLPGAIFSAAAQDVFTIALYRHAAGRPLPEGFPAAELDEAFQPRRRWWRDDED